MSDNIPFEIQAEIIKRVVDLKSLIHFRSVSKQWKSLIESSEFITDHTLNHRTGTHHLLVRYHNTRAGYNKYYKYVSIVDDDSFPQHKFSHVVPPTVKKLVELERMLDSSHGLVCLYGYDSYDINRSIMIVLWNPSIRKSVGITLPRKPTAIGFGVCPKTIDPKIVKITTYWDETPAFGWKAEVFTLSSRAWRSISMNMHLSTSSEFRFKFNQVVVDGVIYWAICDSPNDFISKRIISFDLTSEEFKEVAIPDGLRYADLNISKLKESLVVLDGDDETYDVWKMMKNGLAKLFSFDFRAYDGCELYQITGFRQNGQPIWEHPCEQNGTETKLEAYNPSTKHTTDLGFYLPYSHYGEWYIMVTSYTQSLLLVNHPESVIQG